MNIFSSQQKAEQSRGRQYTRGSFIPSARGVDQIINQHGDVLLVADGSISGRRAVAEVVALAEDGPRQDHHGEEDEEHPHAGKGVDQEHGVPEASCLDPPPGVDERQPLGGVVVEEVEDDVERRGHEEENGDQREEGLDGVASSVVEESVGDLRGGTERSGRSDDEGLISNWYD